MKKESKPNKEQEWSEQEEAFLGLSLKEDEEMAHKLQQQYLNDDQHTLRQLQEQQKQDRELALSLQKDLSSPSSLDYNEDEALARYLEQEELKRAKHRNNSCPIDYPANNRNENGNKVSSPVTLSGIIPRCSICNNIVLMPLSALGRIYHAKCFKCMGCHDVIDPNEPFAVVSGDDGQKYPMHTRCHSEVYGYQCSVCSRKIQSGPDGLIKFIKHPFFENEIMCSHHTRKDVRQCSGCGRFEPFGQGFTDLHDFKRCLCDACIRTCILDSADAKPLWDAVLKFFEHNLGLTIWSDMKDIPVLIVGHDVLNEQQRCEHTGHEGSEQIMTRGLCLSEHQRGFKFMVPSFRFDRKRTSLLPTDAATSGHTYFQIPDATQSNPNATVTAILCLSGLPADLTASILAHEATHAWIKLNPNFDPTHPIPPQVEEGCCQLISMLFLTDGLQESSSNSTDGPSDKKLRQYFKYSIESDKNEIYGEGYRKAAKAYAQIGIEALLSHVVNYRDWPQI